MVTGSVDDGKRIPEILKEDVFMKNGNNRLRTVEFAAAHGARTGLEQFILSMMLRFRAAASSLRSCATSAKPNKRGTKRTTLVQCAPIAQRYSPT